MWEMRPTRQNTSGVVVGRDQHNYVHKKNGGVHKILTNTVTYTKGLKFWKKFFLVIWKKRYNFGGWVG